MSADMAVQECLSLLMSGDVRGIEYGASDHDTGNERCLMAVRDESQGWQRPGNDQVSPFPDGNRACQGACPHCVCRIYGAGIERFFRAEPHHDTSESHDKSHVAARG